MKKKTILLMTAVLAVLAVVLEAAGSSQSAEVVRVYDGDTILVSTRAGEVKVRLLGIDCPESHVNAKCKRDGQSGRRGCRWQIPWGKRAKDVALHMLRNQSITLECDGKCKTDPYDRLLRYIHLPDGRDLGFELVRQGLCEDYSWKYPHPRQKTYQREQNAAQAAQRGIWKD